MKTQFAHSLSYKTNEFFYRLDDLIKVCNMSQRRFDCKQKPLNSDDSKINYKFSAFLSLVMTFRDILNYLTDGSATWATLSVIKHMDFIQQLRHAATHDGTPLINAWIDGRYYIARDIRRLNQHGKKITISVPMIDIRTICLEFSNSFAIELNTIIAPLLNDSRIASQLYTKQDFKQMAQHPAVPEFLRARINRELQTAKVKGTTLHPIAETIKTLESLVKYCNLEQQNNPSQ